ncbi:MAG: phosphate/phosphite/phosphonate ABC transporter substrate-binding protein [Ectothiorhodospiraceae bacterium]|nr:phosphate/phosphite/phosphonate ABC transporter substrate-binding protein [Chromatiales bacterium]MCP5154049.1 phosphate/phosphite/phosphonate ABC transporter substrate-binding protein [Ectothiorhodospiraceae bacterium]
MSQILTVSPDFNTKYLAGWFILNNWLQHALETSIRLEVFDDFERQRDAIRDGKVDLIYANPYDAAWLVRERGYRAVAKPRSKCDETVVATSAQGPVERVEDLSPGITVATTDDPDVHMMGMIMLEPADLGAANVTLKRCENYVLVAKELMRGHAAAGFFLADTYNELSPMIRSKLRVLVESQINVIHHLFLVSPAMGEQAVAVHDALTGLAQSDKGRSVLDDIGIPGWDDVSEEDVEFMIDLMDTLV